MATLQYSANAFFQITTLTSAYLSGGVSLVLLAGTGGRFPASGLFWVRVDSEIFKVTSRATDTLTVVGAQDGTTASNHNTGATVSWVEGVSALNQLRADAAQTGINASKVVEHAGSLYLPSDLPVLWRDTGVTFEPWGPISKLFPPAVAGFSFINQDGATITSDNSGIIVNKLGASASLSITSYVKSIPAAPYTISVFLQFVGSLEDFTQVGIVLSDGTKVATFGIIASGGKLNLVGEKFTNSTSFSATYFGQGYFWTGAGIWLRLRDDSTNRFYDISPDGVNWINRFSVGRTDFLTPTQWGYYVETRGVGNRAYLKTCSQVEA